MIKELRKCLWSSNCLKKKLLGACLRGSLFVVFFVLASLKTFAQYTYYVPDSLYAPPGYMRVLVNGNDTLFLSYLPEVYIYPELKFKNDKEREAYTKLVRDVKKTLPYAKLIYNTLIETYEYIETLPNDKAKEAHLKRMEKELYKQYRPELKKLTLSQGKLLIKLVDRECNQSSYNLVSAYLGSFRATFWNLFAGMLGASLKSKYEPNGNDALTERVVLLVERGLI